MEKKSEFYTLKGYQLHAKKAMTEAMEDYIEMIYRHTKGNVVIRMKELANLLNVSMPSASKMIGRLKQDGYLSFERYGTIQLLKKGIDAGSYLLWRHEVLVRFFKKLNGKDYCLEQVEKIEHFVDFITLCHLEQFFS